MYTLLYYRGQGQDTFQVEEQIRRIYRIWKT